MNDRAEDMKADLVAIITTVESAIRNEQDKTLNELKRSIERGDTQAISFDARWVAKGEDNARKLKRCSSQLLQLINLYIY